jgi:threonine synthase
LRIANNLVANPLLIGVQSKACDPLVDKFNNLDKVLASRNQLPTLAEGVQVCDPLRNQAVIAAVTVSRGWLCAIEEAEILPARNALARLGLYVEPTSAIVYAALSDFINDLPDPIVLILTGSGMKYG